MCSVGCRVKIEKKEICCCCMNMQTHLTQWGKSPYRERAAPRSCKSLREYEPRQCTWAVCSSERWAWFLPPPEGTWPEQQRRRPVHRQIWLSTGRWSPLHPCEGGQSWTHRKAKSTTLKCCQWVFFFPGLNAIAMLLNAILMLLMLIIFGSSLSDQRSSLID